MLTMSTYSEKSWNSSEDYEDDNSSTSSPVQRRINNGEMVEVNGNSVITTHCVSSVIKPGDKQLHDPLQFVKIKSCELSKKAKEQIKLAEEVKITKEKIKEVEEEWQNNLLNWKSKRRQNKRNNDEELNSINNQRKIKTFSAILNEKAKSGHRIGYNLHHYLMNEDNNLIDQLTESNNESDQSSKQDEAKSDQLDQTDQTDQTDCMNEKTKELSNQKEELNSQLETIDKHDEQDQTELITTNTDLLKEYSSNLSQNEFAQNNQTKKENRNQFNQTSNQQTNETESKVNSSCKLNNKKEIFNQQPQKSPTVKRTEPERQDEGKKLSFKAKLSAFENLTKNEVKKPLEKTPPVKNKLRMSSSNNLITDKKLIEETKEEIGNFSKRFTSKSNENLSKFKNNQADTKTNKRTEFNFTKSESNLNTKLNSNVNQSSKTNQQQQQPFGYQNAQSDYTQSDEQLNKENLTEINNYELMNTRSNNEVISTAISAKDTINNIQQFDCDYEVSELSKRMQHQLSTSPNVLHQQQQSKTHLNTYDPNTNQLTGTAVADSTGHSNQTFMTSIEELNPLNNQTNYFNDDYANSQLFNQHHQISSHNLINNLQPQYMSDYSVDSNQQILNQQTNQLYQTVANQQKSISNSMLPQAGQFYEENVYGNYYNTGNQGINAYQLQKHNRSTSSSHLEYANGLPPVTSQVYYHNKSSALNASSGNLNTNQSGLPAQAYSTSATQLINRQSQPQINTINTTQTPQLTHQTQPYNYNHWLIQEAELRRQIATQNGSSLIASTKNQSHNLHQLKANQHLNKPTSQPNIYKDDQPVYENTIVYNSHKKQQQLHQQQQLTNNYLGNQVKPPYPNPNQLISNQNLNNSSTSVSSSQQQNYLQTQQQQQKQILSVSGKKKCSNCGDDLGRGCAAMVIETLSLYYHINCFRCSVCHVILGNGTCGTDVRVRNHKLHCLDCYSNDQGKGIFY